MGKIHFFYWDLSIGGDVRSMGFCERIWIKKIVEKIYIGYGY
jgi:hypothetical protein